MIKLKKRVAVNKITHFFETTSLVIFFHCNNRKEVSERVRRSLLLSNKISSSSFSFAEKEKRKLDSAYIINDDENFLIKKIKNNYARKALFEKKPLKNRPLWIPSGSSSDPKSDISRISEACPRRGSEGETKENKNGNFLFTSSISLKQDKKEKISKASLYQGKNLLLTFKNIKSLSSLLYLEDFLKQENIEILGGIYENCIVDHNQIKRLATLTQDLQIYKKLSDHLQNHFFCLINNLKQKLDLSYLLFIHYKITFSLKSVIFSKR